MRIETSSKTTLVSPTTEELWAAYAHDPEGHLLTPHVGGRRCIMDWHHPELEKLIEIGSAWGHFGWLYQDAMKRGYKIGASMVFRQT